MGYTVSFCRVGSAGLWAAEWAGLQGLPKLGEAGGEGVREKARPRSPRPDCELERSKTPYME